MIWLFVFLAALLIPEAAHAGFVATAISVALAASSAGAGFGAALAAGFGVITSTFVGKLLVGTALSLVGQLFAQKPPGIKPQGIQTEQTTTGDVTPQKFVVGKYAVEGHAVAPAYSRDGGDPNSILTYILEVSNIPVKGLTGRVIVDGQYTSLVASAEDAARLDFSDLGLGPWGNNPNGWLWFLDGTQTTAFSGLVNFYGSHPDRPWTSDHILEGTAYAVCEFVFNQEVYSGLPAIRFEVEGIALYDPRKDTSVGGSGAHRWDDPSTWEFTQNPQVINYNILRGITLPTGDIWGGEVPAEDLPLDNWFAAMNECDVLIGDRPQYQAGFEVNVGEMEPWEVIQEMNRSSFAQISEFGGVFRVRVGAPASPVMSLTDGDFTITEPSNYNPFPSLTETYNAVTATYVEPVDVWEARSADAILNSTWEAEDEGRRLPIELNLPAVSNKSQVQQLMAAYIKDQRRFRAHRMVLPPSFAMLEPLDTIEWTSDVNGYTVKVFEVVSVEHRSDTLQQAVTVRERDATDTAWSTDDDVPAPDPINALTFPDNFVSAGFDPDTMWNGRFRFGLLGWETELYDGSADITNHDASTMRVVQRDSGSAKEALKAAPTINFVELDWGDFPVDDDDPIFNRLIWRGLIPVQPGAEVHMSLRHAADPADPDDISFVPQSIVRGTLRWYDEDGTQLSAPDDETDDTYMQVEDPTLFDEGDWWKTWQRSSLPPNGAAYCRPVVEFRELGLSKVYVSEIDVQTSLDTTKLRPNSVTDDATTSVSTTNLATDATEEVIATATVEVPDISTGSGEQFAIHASCYVNAIFSGVSTLTVRLAIDGTNIASGGTDADGVIALSGRTAKGSGPRDIEIKASATDVSEFFISEARVTALVLKR